ncbi:MAG TPA: hypothetical protein VFE60_11880 [Roseiarcus sp.]|nr:hypothetical protein [Roseiarcus sp.]
MKRESTLRSSPEVRRCLALEPNFAEGHLQLANLHYILAMLGSIRSILDVNIASMAGEIVVRPHKKRPLQRDESQGSSPNEIVRSGMGSKGRAR